MHCPKSYTIHLYVVQIFIVLLSGLKPKYRSMSYEMLKFFYNDADVKRLKELTEACREDVSECFMVHFISNVSCYVCMSNNFFADQSG